MHNSARRSALFGTSAALVAVAVAGCTSGAVTTASVEQVIAEMQALLPFLDVLATGISIAVPAAAPLLAIVMPYLANASTIFATISSTMTQVEAAPIVQKFSDAIAGALNAIDEEISSVPAGSPLVKFQPLLAQANAVFALLLAFYNAIPPAVGSVHRMPPNDLWIRHVH